MKGMSFANVSFIHSGNRARSVAEEPKLVGEPIKGIPEDKHETIKIQVGLSPRMAEGCTHRTLPALSLHCYTASGVSASRQEIAILTDWAEPFPVCFQVPLDIGLGPLPINMAHKCMATNKNMTVSLTVRFDPLTPQTST